MLKVIPSRLPLPPIPLAAVTLAPHFKMGTKRPAPMYLFQEQALPDNRDYGHFVAFGPTHDASKATVTVAEASLLKRPRLVLDVTPVWRGNRKEGDAPDFAQVFGAATNIRTSKDPLPCPPVKDAPALLAAMRTEASALSEGSLVAQNSILLHMLQTYQDARMRGRSPTTISREERLARDWLVANLSQLVGKHAPKAFLPAPGRPGRGVQELMDAHVGERRPQYRGQLPVDTRKFPVFTSNRNVSMEAAAAAAAGTPYPGGKAAGGAGWSGKSGYPPSAGPGGSMPIVPNFQGTSSLPSSMPQTPVPGMGHGVGPRPIVNVVAQPPPPPVFLSIPTTALHK